MENFLCIAYIQLKVFRLFLYYMFKHGKIPISYSMFKMLISNIMEIKRKFRPDSNSLWRSHSDTPFPSD